MTEYLDITGGWHRIVGQVVEVMRGRWAYGVIALLAEGKKTPVQLHGELTEIHNRLRWLCGDRPLADDALYKPLVSMAAEGLLEHEDEPSAFPLVAYYKLSELSTALLGALDQLGPWCETHYDYLEQKTRIKYGVDLASPVEQPPVIGPRAQGQIAWRRRGVGMAFGLFTPRWSWGLLSVISEGPRSPGGLFTEHNNRVTRNSHFTGRRMMSPKVGYEMLSWLDQCDLILKRDSAGDEPGRVVYELTPHGRSLMSAFKPVGETMTPYYEDLVTILRGRRGLSRLDAAVNEPWPSTVLTG